jgi:hypothetical protein
MLVANTLCWFCHDVAQLFLIFNKDFKLQQHESVTIKTGRSNKILKARQF